MSRWQDVEGKKVYIGNLDSDTTTEDLEKVFSKHGAIQSVWVARNPPGFAFVTYEDERDAQDAVYYLDGTSFNKKHIRVEIARGPRNSNKVPADWKLRDKNRSFYDRKFNGGNDGYSGGGSGYSRRSPSYGRYEREDDRGRTSGGGTLDDDDGDSSQDSADLAPRGGRFNKSHYNINENPYSSYKYKTTQVTASGSSRERQTKDRSTNNYRRSRSRSDSYDRHGRRSSRESSYSFSSGRRKGETKQWKNEGRSRSGAEGGRSGSGDARTYANNSHRY